MPFLAGYTSTEPSLSHAQSELAHRTGAEPRKRVIARKTSAYFYFGDSNIDRQIAKFTGYTVFLSLSRDLYNISGGIGFKKQNAIHRILL